MDRRSSLVAWLAAPCTLGAFLFFEPLGCLQPLDPDAADGGAAATSSPPTVGDAGTDCTQDPTTGITLCADISTCPSVSVSSTTLAGCGFLIQDDPSTLVLECNCGNYLCPIGVPGTCAQAANLLTGLSSTTVCQQALEGECVQEVTASVAAAPAPTSTATTTSTTTTGSGTSTPTSTCNTQCIINCGDAPDCQQLCGC